MAINRKSRLKPGSIHPSLVNETTGLSIDDNGILNASVLNTRINDLKDIFDAIPWKNTINNKEIFNDPEILTGDRDLEILRHDLLIGNVYYSTTDKVFLVYIDDITGLDNYYQPVNWTAANRTEGFLEIPLTLDLADKTYVDDQISSLIGIDAQTLQDIQDLLDYIANNPTANIINRIVALETDKANRSEIYTTDILDAKFANLEEDIDSFTDGFFIPTNYSCGSDPNDSNSNINTLYEDTKARITTGFTLNYLIKQGVEVSEQALVLNQAPIVFTGMQSQKNLLFSRLNKVEIDRDLTIDQGDTDYLQFDNIWFAYGFEVKATSEYVKITFNNCLFENTSLAGGDVFSSLVLDTNINKIDLEFINCTFNLSSNSKLNLKRVNASFKDCYFIEFGNTHSIELSSQSNVSIIDSYTEACIKVIDNSVLNLESITFKKEANQNSYLDVSNLDQNLDSSLVKLKDITFNTYNGFTSNYVSGTGQVYLDYNIIETNLKDAEVDGTKISVPTFSNTLNAGSGIELKNYFTPFGSENFFYNDEFARDAIAAMITSSTHSDGVVWTYDDPNNKFSLSLDTLSSTNLADTNNIAYKNQANTFTETNTFSNLNTTNITNTNNISSSSMGVTSATITSLSTTNLTTTTQLPTDNSTKAATTAFVQERFSNLVAQFNSTELNELSDVTITNPTAPHILQYNGTNSQWENKQLDYDHLLNTSKVVIENDSIFRLKQIDPPTDLRDDGAIPNTTRYQSTNQVLAWNGVDRRNETTGDVNLDAKYIPVLINEIILYAQEADGLDGESTPGAGIITIASTDEVRDGTDTDKAVIPSYLNDHYLRRDASNIDESETQTARNNLDIDSEFVKIDLSNATAADNYRNHIGLPALEAGKYLIGTANSWVNVDRTLGYLQPKGLDFTILGSNQWDALPSYFYNVKTPANQTKTIILPDLNSLNPQGSTIKIKKENGSTHLLDGTVSIRANNLDDVIITADNEVITSSGSNHAQVDILVEGHTVDLYVGYSVTLDKRVWYAFGYYYNSADQTQPVPVIDLTQEATEDAIISLFNHNDHSPALSVNYDDPNHQVELNLSFASQAQVTAGTITDLPIAPDTLKVITDAINTSITDLGTFASNTYLAKNSNLSDLQDAPTARTNLGLGTAATYNVGIAVNELLINGTLTANKFTYFNGNKLITNDLPVSTENINGLIKTTRTQDVVTANTLSDDRALTPYDLNEAIITTTQVSTIRDSILSLTNTLQYIPSSTTTIQAQAGKHYSLRAIQGSITITLPDITTVPLASYIIIKLKEISNNNTVTILPQQNQTIDFNNSFDLDVQGQSLTLVAGNDNNETDWEII